MTENKDRPELSIEKVAEGLTWLNSLVSKPEDYQRLTTAANELGIVVRDYLSSETREEKVDGIISYVIKSDPNNHLLEFFVHAVVIDQETSKLTSHKKDLATRITEQINQLSGPIAEDDSVRSLGLGIRSLLDLYERLEANLSADEKQMLFNKINLLGRKLEDKIAKRASDRIKKLKEEPDKADKNILKKLFGD
jgi:hypothetical protein